MPNPTRQEILDAHEALIELCRLAEELAVTEVQDRQAWKYHASIRAALPPKPQPTMAEVEWDDEEHYLAEAEYIDCGKVIMLYRDEDDGLIQCQIIGGKHSAFFAYSGNLTPTGRRYTLTEVQE